MNLISFSYGYDAAGQRLGATQSGTAFSAYGSSPVVYTYAYDNVGQLTTASGAIGSTLMSGRQYGYSYDGAGNRASGNMTGVPAQADNYTLNTLNQITKKDNKTVAVQGSANATHVLVTANGVSATAGIAGSYWGTNASLPNGSGPATGTVNIVAALIGGGSGGTDLVASTGVNAYLPPLSEAMTWDQDGNLLTDGTWDYTWNAENQLVSMVNTPAQPAGVTAETIQFSYDYLGRRIKKSVTVNGTTTEHRYVYNGWNVMAELDASGNVLRHFIWGLDLSGTMGGAGGIGGLLMIQDSGSTYFPGYDGNGNVVTLTNAATGSLAATYEYSPFGELLQASGSYAASNPFRFSTKWWDAETGYVYYGARYYSPRLGRFLNQDPIQEKGGINLYGFCGNDPVDHWDLLGQDRNAAPMSQLSDGTWIWEDTDGPTFDSQWNAFVDQANRSATTAAVPVDADGKLQTYSSFSSDTYDSIMTRTNAILDIRSALASLLGSGQAAIQRDANGNMTIASYTTAAAATVHAIGASYAEATGKSAFAGSVLVEAVTRYNQSVPFGTRLDSGAAPNNAASTNTGANLATAAVAGTVIAAPGTLAGTGGGATAGEVIAAASRAGALVAVGAVVMAIPGDTYRNPNLVSFRRYDHAASAPGYLTFGRMVPTTWAAPLSDPIMSSSQAQQLYALPPGPPRDTYYIITIDPREIPYIGPMEVQRQPQWNESGGANEVKILLPIPAGQIQGPFQLPPDPTK